MSVGVAEAFESHIAGLIDGERLRLSEAEHWIWLLGEAAEHPTPVARARYFGFAFVSRRAHIREAIDYLATV